MPKWNETGYRGLLIQDVQAVRGGVSDVAARPKGPTAEARNVPQSERPQLVLEKLLWECYQF